VSRHLSRYAQRSSSRAVPMRQNVTKPRPAWIAHRQAVDFVEAEGLHQGQILSCCSGHADSGTICMSCLTS
jgi:hypothetical protein